MNAKSRISAALRKRLLPQCRLKPGQVWEDSQKGHRVGCLDATKAVEVEALMRGQKLGLAVMDPPYNVAALELRSLKDYLAFSRAWVGNVMPYLRKDAAFYVWLGADQNRGFQPLPDFMLMMREAFPVLKSRSFLTLRNQRGYGTQQNWMSLRQELLYYVKGKPGFRPQYTQIPKILRGYYKKVGGKLTENGQRSKSPFIRAGNVWVDVQQVFHLLHENVALAYAQKPLAAIERILEASSKPGDWVADFFSHAGTTLLACERLGRRCLTMDLDPLYAELSIRRLERFRATGKSGWQRADPFGK